MNKQFSEMKYKQPMYEKIFNLTSKQENAN